MIRRFRVKVDGKTYDVEVEELGAESNAAPQPVLSKSVANSVPVVSTPAARSAQGQCAPGQVVSPIPGKVLKVLADIGKKVARGDILMVIESMKIENPILAPMGGSVVDVKVAQGAHVCTGDLLFVLG